MQKLSFVERIGNVMSTLLLGQTKEMIVRMDERIHHLDKNVNSIQKQITQEIIPDLRDTRERLIKVELGLENVEIRLTTVETRLGTVELRLGQVEARVA